MFYACYIIINVIFIFMLIFIVVIPPVAITAAAW